MAKGVTFCKKVLGPKVTMRVHIVQSRQTSASSAFGSWGFNLHHGKTSFVYKVNYVQYTLGKACGVCLALLHKKKFLRSLKCVENYMEMTKLMWYRPQGQNTALSYLGHAK